MAIIMVALSVLLALLFGVQSVMNFRADKNLLGLLNAATAILWLVSATLWTSTARLQRKSDELSRMRSL